MLKTIKKLLYIIPARKISLAVMVALFLFSSGLEVVGIGAIAPFIDLAGNPNLIYQHPILEKLFDTSGITDESLFIASLGLLVILLFCVKVFIAWFTQVFIYKFSCRQQRLLIIKFLDKYLSAPYTYHLEKNSSYIIDNILEIANRFNLIVQSLFVSISNILIAAALFTVLWISSSQVMLILLTILLPLLVLINSFKQKLRDWGQQTRHSKARLIKVINHSLGGIKETKVIGCEDYFKNQVSLHTKQLEASQSNFFGFNIMPRFLIEAVMLISAISVISYFLFIGSDISKLHSILGLYALASIRFLPALSQAVGGINHLRNSAYTIDQIYLDLRELRQECKQLNQYNLVVSEPGKINNSKSIKKISFHNYISLERISYQYPNQLDYAIKDLSLNIKKGDSIAFIGKSGAGKTTLVDIILGLLIPQEGDIKVDGISIGDNLRGWQNLVGYIPQSIFIADDTLRNNVAFGIPDDLIDLDRLHKALEAAQLLDVVTDLPKGIHTRLGERGVLLSGGQRQRVGIARALYHQREILILDEATAALDNETEKLVTNAINTLSGKKTLIIIAHRLSTVEKCDRVYKLNRGQVISSGSYQEIVS